MRKTNAVCRRISRCLLMFALLASCACSELRDSHGNAGSGGSLSLEGIEAGTSATAGSEPPSQEFGCRALPAPPPAGPIRLERTFVGASLVKAVELVEAPDSSETFYVALQSGEVMRVQPDHEPVAVLDLGPQLELRSSESGLVSFALHPDFGANGYAFAVYSTAASGSGFYSRLSRFERGADGAFVADSELVLLDILQTDAAHTGNHVAFGPDGFLYYAVGDDRRTDVHAQDPETLQGKILRIDVDRTDAERGTPYGIPADNPFVAGGGAPEVYAYGLRNPWRMTFDPDTGELFVGDVGQDRREEIDRIVSGGNYGWPFKEGTLCFREEPCDMPGLIDPVVELSHPMAKSVVAGYRYTRGDVPDLDERYMVADFISGTLWSIDPEEDVPELRQAWEGEFPVVSMTRASDGTLYVVRYETEGDDGGVYRVVPNDAPPAVFPKRLTETGCVDSDDPRNPAPILRPYAPIAPLWSDGAAKERYFVLPESKVIGVSEDGDFDFPEGTVLVKHFLTGGRYHETRLLMRYDDTWTGYSYRWSQDQRDAYLLEGSVDAQLEDGTRWHYPSRSECNQCHTRAAGHSLGLEVAQLDHALDPGSGNQLDELFVAGLLDIDGAALEALRSSVGRLVNPAGLANNEARARSYLHSNCSNCHRPGALGRGDIDLRFSANVDGLCGTRPGTGRIWDTGNWEDQYLIVPGRKEDSVLWMRMALQGHFRMPPLGSDVVDPDGLSAVGAWIDGLESCGESQSTEDNTPCTTEPGMCPGSDRCWDLKYGCDECEEGYVWREIPNAPDGDRICVLPATRARVQEENAQHESRVDPANQDFGPNTCQPPYVWRQAFAGDEICVSTSSRDRAAQENEEHDSHTKVGAGS